MSSYTAGGLTGAGSTTLPLAALIGAANNRLKVFEIGIFNTTSTAVALKLCRLSTAGTPGSNLSTPNNETDPEETATPTGVLKGTYSSTAPTTADGGRRAILGAAVGSAVIWTFPKGLIVPAVAAAGVGILVENGTGQAVQCYFAWDE